jgi:preprotein translocase subunit SecD
MRPGRQLAGLGLIFAILAALVWFTAPSGAGWQERLEPRLGLDLVGGQRVTLEAKTLNGQPPSPQDLEEAKDIIEQRVNGKGVTEAEVVTEGGTRIVISVAGKSNDAIRDVGESSKMFFRKVLNVTNGAPGVTAAPAPSASPSVSAAPSTSAGATPTPQASGTGGGAQVEPSATPSSAPSPTPSASASAAPVADPEPNYNDAVERQVTLAEVQAKVGKEAWDAASALTAPVADPAQLEVLKPFNKLDQYEINALPVEIQFNVPQIDCLGLDARPIGSVEDAGKKVVACEMASGRKYLLDVAKVAGTDIADASSQLSQTNERVVMLNFTGDGQKKWTALTKEAYGNEGDPKCDTTNAVDESGRCAVAVVLDNDIISAPFIQGVLTNNSSITGQFTAEQANDLANKLNFGALAVSFEPKEAVSVTPTLGAEHLQAGLLAAGIGLLLVVIYSFFYYRLLGTVIFLSLILSAVLTFLMIVFLGRQIGFTLTLAGFAGFIVSLGVAADSFVIYFERLKDEIREGRSPRSAVPRAWARARRTILTANAISLMAAVVLYLLSAGAVKGFAFALGVATILDLVVVFLFRHPIMTMFARTSAFLSPRVSGLGRVLSAHKEAKS